MLTMRCLPLLVVSISTFTLRPSMPGWMIYASDMLALVRTAWPVVNVISKAGLPMLEFASRLDGFDGLSH